MKGKITMKKESMIDLAYKILSESNEPVAFGDLWGKIKTELEIGPDEEQARIGHFYTDLSLDGRFVQDGDYTWNLRSRTLFDKTRIDTSVFYENDEQEADRDETDVKEEAEYNASVAGESISSDDQDSDEGDESSHKTETAADLGVKII